MMKSEARRALEQRLNYLEKNRHNLVIDADTHISNLDTLSPVLKEKLEHNPNYYHGRPISAEMLITEMDMNGIDMSLSWQNPAATWYSDDPMKNFDALLKANAYIAGSASRYPERILPAGWTDPKSLSMESALQLAEICVHEFGFSIVKLNPAQNEFPIDSPEVLMVVEKIISLGATPAFHFGADTPFTPPEGLENVARRFAPHPVIGVHMGGGGAAYPAADYHYRQARKLGLKYPNIKFILSAKRDTHMESDLIMYEIAGEPFNRNLCCASDAPYGRQSWNYGGFRAMFNTLQNGAAHTDPRVRNHPGLFTDEAVQRYLGRNFADITIESIKNVLEIN